MSSLRILGLTLLFVIVAVTGCGQGSDRSAALTIAPADALPASSGAPAVNSKAAMDPIKELQAINTPDGVDPALFKQLKDELERELRAKGATKAVSKPPAEGFGKVTDLTATSVAGTYYIDLSWSYRNDGDYNQDGKVNVLDIVPLAQHFGEAVIDESTIEGVIDTSNNGSVGTEDISSIARNFGVEVAAYRISIQYGQFGYIDLIASAPFTDAIGEGSERKTFAARVTTYTTYRYYLVNPVDSNYEDGEYSETAVLDETGNSLTFSISGSVSDLMGNGIVGVEVYLDGKLATTTGEQGSFTISGLSNRTYYVSPASDDYIIGPSGTSIYVEAADVRNVNFIARHKLNATWRYVEFYGDYASSFSYVNGKPALISVANVDEGAHLWSYAKSIDEYGLSWLPQSHFATTFNRAPNLSLHDAAGLPGVFVGPDADEKMYFMRAEDEEGTSWESSGDIPMPDVTSGWDAAILYSAPAVAISYDNKVLFTHADDINGAHWSTEVVADNVISDMAISLSDINGHPAIAFCEDGTSHVHWSIRDLNYPPYWREPQQVSFQANNPKFGYIKLACIAGKPAILAAFYGKEDRYGLPQYAEVTGDDPLKIDDGEYIDAMYNVAGSVHLVDYMGNPAIAYSSVYYDFPIVAVRMEGTWNYTTLASGHRPLDLFVSRGKLVVPSGYYYYTSPLAYYVNSVAWME
jgi:hypothetical protein